MSRLVVTPAELGKLGVEGVRSLHAKRDRLWPILLPGMDDYFAPLEPGSLTVVQAQTHNGKSLFMSKWRDRGVAYLSQQRREEIVVWIDTEISADYLAMSTVMREAGIRYNEVLFSRNGLDVAALMRAAENVAGLPTYTIATRLGQRHGNAEVTLTNIRNGLAALTNGTVDGRKRRIAAIFIDYLQALPLDTAVKRAPMENQRRLQVAKDVDLCRELGAEFDAPVILGVQSKQQLEPSKTSKALALPGMYDGMETANIAQRTDRMITLSVGPRNFPRGAVLDYAGHSLVVRDGTMFVYVAKQRVPNGYLPAGHVFAYEITDSADPFQSFVHTWSEW